MPPSAGIQTADGPPPWITHHRLASPVAVTVSGAAGASLMARELQPNNGPGAAPPSPRYSRLSPPSPCSPAALIAEVITEEADSV